MAGMRIDIEPDTLCIVPEEIEDAINERTKAITPVRAYISMADMDHNLLERYRNTLLYLEERLARSIKIRVQNLKVRLSGKAVMSG